MDYKEMSYTKRYKLPKTLYKDEHKGIDILVLSMGSHPCAYIGVDKDSEFVKSIKDKDYDDIELSDYVHGGITYAGVGEGEVRPSNKFWIGWDYAHMGDYFHIGIKCPKGMKGHKWTTQEMIDDAKEAIERMIKLSSK
jgi:hypothetical protein